MRDFAEIADPRLAAAVLSSSLDNDKNKQYPLDRAQKIPVNCTTPVQLNGQAWSSPTQFATANRIQWLRKLTISGFLELPHRFQVVAHQMS